MKLFSSKSIFRILAVLPLLCGGCIHLHNAERQKTAEALQSSLKAYAENSPKMYEAMKSNVEKFKLHEDTVLGVLSENSAMAFIEALPSMDGAGLAGKIDGTRNILSETEISLITAGTNYLLTAHHIKDEVKAGSAVIAKLRSSVKQIRDEVDQWNQTVALLKTAAGQLPGALVANTNKATTGSQLKEVIATLGTNTIVYQDSYGTNQTNTVKAIVEESVKGMFGTNGFSLPAPPGIKLRLMTLGLEVAEAERDRGQMQLVRISDRLLVYEDIYRELCLAEALLKQAKKDLETVTSSKTNNLAYSIESNAGATRLARDGFIQSINSTNTGRKGKLFEDYQTALNQNADLFRGLRLFTAANAVAVRNEARVKVETKRLDHLDSIVISKYNDRIWQLYLQGGADALVAYHRGGFSQEDAAQIVRIAQAVAIGVLAGNSF